VRGQRLSLIVSVVLLLVAGGLAAAQKWAGAWWWIPVSAAGLTAVVVGAGPLWQRWRTDQAAAAVKMRRSVRGTQGRAGDRLPTVAEANLRTLRVHPAVIDVPYLHRVAKEQEVRELLIAGRPVLLVGSSMVGKTRLAAAVVRELYPDWRLLIPDTTSALLALDEADMLPGNCVIWLDDLDQYLTGGGLTAGLIMRLAERNAVVATLRAREWDRLQPTDRLRAPEWDALSVFEKVTLDRERDRPSDEDLARAVPDAEVRDRIMRVGIGEYVGGGQHIAAQLEIGPQSHPLGYALLRGAVDWRQTGVMRPVPACLLPALAAARLTPRRRNALADDATYADALAWATREINPTVALLEPGDRVFTVYDFALDQLTAIDDAPPAATWQLVVDNAEPRELVAIGYQAEVTYGQHDVAEGAWRRAGEAGESSATFLLGALFQMRGDLTEAEIWYRRAAEAGDSGAMFLLGGLLQMRGNLTEAETWYWRSIEAGDSGVVSELEGLLQEVGDITGAEAWDRRDSIAMAALGAVFHQRGDLTEAETWYRRAAENGSSAGMIGLGALLLQGGNLTEAKTWYRRASEDGSSVAATRVALILEIEARRRQAAEHGCSAP
jgi:TPR repeat protein